MITRGHHLISAMLTQWETSDVYKAIKSDDIDAIQRLLEDSPQLCKETTSSGDSLLHKAVQDGCSCEMLEVLVPQIPLETRNAHGHTAFQLAMEKVQEQQLID